MYVDAVNHLLCTLGSHATTHASSPKQSQTGYLCKIEVGIGQTAQQTVSCLKKNTHTFKYNMTSAAEIVDFRSKVHCWCLRYNPKTCLRKVTMTFEQENLICLIINSISRVSLGVSLFCYTQMCKRHLQDKHTDEWTNEKKTDNVMPSHALLVFAGGLNNSVLRSQKSSYLSCDCSSYILSFPSLKRRMARLDFFIRLSM